MKIEIFKKKENSKDLTVNGSFFLFGLLNLGIRHGNEFLFFVCVWRGRSLKLLSVVFRQSQKRTDQKRKLSKTRRPWGNALTRL